MPEMVLTRITSADISHKYERHTCMQFQADDIHDNDKYSKFISVTSQIVYSSCWLMIISVYVNGGQWFKVYCIFYIVYARPGYSFYVF